jgi:PAS domain S-box-containing protein
MTAAAPRRAAALIRVRRDEIVRTWEAAVRAMPHATTLDRPALIDQIPDLLDHIAHAADELEHGGPPAPRPDDTERHGIAELDHGFDLLDVVGELRALRRCIVKLFAGENRGVIDVDELELVEDATDAAVAGSIQQYIEHALHDQAPRPGAQITEHERQFYALADHVPQPVWISGPDGENRWCNQRWCEYTGISLEETEGWGWEKVVRPDHLARVAEHWRWAVEHGVAWEDTFPVRGADGCYRWFLSRARPIRDASGRIERWVGTNTDVTAHRFLDEATRILTSTLDVGGALERLAQLAVPDLADWCVVDLLDRGQLEHVAIVHGDPAKRAAACELARRVPVDLGWTGGVGQILRSGTAAVVPELTDQALAAYGWAPDHARQLRALGFQSWIGAPLVARGSTIGVLHLILCDSSRRYRDEDVELAVELGRRAGMAVDNARLYSEAQTAVRVRDDVLAVVSHDLRSPLQAMGLGATMLQQQCGADPDARRYLETIRRSVDRMEHLINDLLDMASINAGRLAIKPARIAADLLLAEIVDMYEPLAAERGIRVVRDHEIGDVALHVDRDRIAQAFGNLLGNAIKFCRPGDVITVRSRRAGDRLQFTIADTGPGIAKHDLPHLFEAYWSGRSGKQKGAGLGLFITKAIIEAHHGDIAASSSDGAGAMFVVTLPVATEPREPRA